MSKKRKPGPWPPAALEYILGLVRFQTRELKNHEEITFCSGLERLDEREWKLYVHASTEGEDGHVIELSCGAYWMRGTWTAKNWRGTKDGEELDMEEGLSAALAALNPNKLGAPGDSAVHHAAKAKRDRGVEVRTTSVVRI